MPYGITQCYLPPDRGDIPALTPAEAGTRLSDPGGMQGWVDLDTRVFVNWNNAERRRTYGQSAIALYWSVRSMTTTETTTLTTSSLNCVVSCYLRTQLKTKLFLSSEDQTTSRSIYTGVRGLLSRRWTGISWKYTHSVLPQRVRQECTYVLANDAAACMMRVHNRQRRLRNRLSSNCVVTEDNASEYRPFVSWHRRTGRDS